MIWCFLKLKVMYTEGNVKIHKITDLKICIKTLTLGIRSGLTVTPGTVVFQFLRTGPYCEYRRKVGNRTRKEKNTPFLV